MTLPLKYQTLLSRFLDTNGDGTGTKNAVGDYSGGATDFYIEPGASETFWVHKLVVFVEDDGAFSAGGYGAGSAVTNGVKVLVTDNDAPTTLVDLLDGVPVKTHDQYGAHRMNTDGWDASSTVRGAQFTLDFVEACGAPLELDGADGHRLAVRLEDDYSALGVGLTGHYFKAYGTQRAT